MNAERHRRISELFAGAAGLDPAERAAYLDRWCGEDARLRAEVEELLSHHADDSFLGGGRAATITTPGADADRRVDVDADPDADAEKLPSAIGPYRILGVLGEGGMGVVYLAEQRAPIRRRVAIKVIRLGMDSKQVLARFELERQALAVMNHPAIAKVFDAGMTKQGQPYFVMESVEGLPIDDYCDRNKLSISDRIGVFQQVCRAVQHAHQKGVLHRDLTPRNVLVSRKGDEHAVKIIDFGLARATDHKLVDNTVYTEQGQVIGTPEYMSPEQASGSAPDIDTRTDIYSLGVLLYHLLTGELPFSSAQLRQAGLLEIQRIIREVDPDKPSTKISSAGDSASEWALKRQLSPSALRKNLRGDLDWIVMRAMAKEPVRRYDSATNLAQDLQRYLDHEPVEAGPPGIRYRLGKLARKYRVQFVASALVVAALVLGVIGTGIGFYREAQAREEVEYLGTFNTLAYVLELDELVADAEKLYPAWPDKVDDLREWIEQRAVPIVSRIPELDAALPRIRARADVAASPRSRDAMNTLHHQVQGFIRRLREFDNETGLLAQMHKRAEWAEKVTSWTIDRFQAEWTAAIAAIKTDPRYRGLQLRPQVGLIPLGRDETSGLWEFLHLRSRAPGADHDPPLPKPDETGHRRAVTETGIIFVLVPPGEFTMGCQGDDPNKACFDAQADPDWGPPHKVRLDPFFLSKYELTQMQWIALDHPLRGFDEERNPSRYAAHKFEESSFCNPVENVSWERVDRLLRKHGLILPTEAQWEYACRAGTEFPWSSGPKPNSLKGHANIADRVYAKRVGENSGERVSDVDDGHAIHAPAGTYRPNLFGLFDMHGNVWEWCLDWHGGYSLDVAPGTGLRSVTEESGSSTRRMFRGGGFNAIAEDARSALRRRGAKSLQNYAIGCRAARRIVQ